MSVLKLTVHSHVTELLEQKKKASRPCYDFMFIRIFIVYYHTETCTVYWKIKYLLNS